MFVTQFVILCAFVIVVTKEDWVEIPQDSGTFFSETKTPMEVVIDTVQIESVDQSYNTTITNRISVKDNDRITSKAAKSSIMEVFSSGTSTEFTPLMSSISTAMSTPVTTPVPVPNTRTTESRIMRKNRNKLNNYPDEIQVEYDTENREIPAENIFSSYAGFMPFIRSIQRTLMERAHKSVKSKIDILKKLRDNLLYNIDEKIKKLWSSEESTAREHKGDSHIEFPSNEGALMTIGFLTLAVFLVKLVLQVIAAIKAKKAYYNTTTTTAATSGRKKRFAPDNGLDDETTYRILHLIDTYKANSFDYN